MRIFILSYVMLFGYVTVYAQNSEIVSKLEQAHSLFKEGDHNKAETLYTSVLASDYRSADLYHNLGVIYHQQGKIAEAILSYRRGLLLDPSHEDLNEKLELARSSIRNDVIEIKEFYPLRMWNKLANSFSGSIWFMLQIMIAGFMLYVLYKWRFQTDNSYKIRYFVSSVSALILLIIACLLGLSSDTNRYDSDLAVVMKESSLMSGADERSDNLRALSPGITVEILDRDISDWYKISLANKEMGWINKEDIEEI